MHIVTIDNNWLKNGVDDFIFGSIIIAAIVVFLLSENCEEDCILLFLYILFFFADLVVPLVAYFDQIPPDLRLLLLVT